MSVNWVLVTTDGKDIVPLENETIFFREQGVRFELDCSNGGYPGAGASYASKDGTLLLTNQRVVYLCAEPTAFFSSASLPIGNIHDSKLVQPWFSAAFFKAVAMPVPRGGLTQPARLSITFSSKKMDGAAPQHLEQLPVYVPPSEPVPEPTATTDLTSTLDPSRTTSASTPLPEPSSTSNPVQSSVQPTAASTGPPPPQPLFQAQPHAIPSDLPPSYDQFR
ncbi:hypothetical protein BGZ80_004448 [Entomortierella chlamydospora]|uniref:Uncharacterized protein n=1 Tax=Entomortierella chlamydospora TaxID=101097 RepID=A0A9P6N132_9FUNG|nr:hypothetical protein BGZ79_010699 [Entomortierella chlamydospora]KAG0020286.1 hypothetical protein BGZ80_004448 [Entomortierella chlamydospora]